MAADYIFFGGEVVTVNQIDEVVEAVAVEGNEILAAGTDEEVLRLQGAETVMVDLRGRSLLPGFIDSHIHVLLHGANHLGVDCKNGVESLEDISERLSKRAAETPPGGWVRGWGYSDQRLAEGRHPTREDLDRVSIEHPILLARTCNHISVANSRALEVLGITRDTPDPEGGEISRGANGEPDGILKETAHMSAFQTTRYDEEEMLEALKIADRNLVSLGITSVHEAGGYGPAQMRIMQRASSEGSLRVRMYAMVCSLHESEKFVEKMISAGVTTGLGDERFRIGPAKVFTDGSSSGPTCATREPYTSDPDEHRHPLLHSGRGG